MVIRKAWLADADDIARVHADSWREAYRGIVPEEAFKLRFSFGPRRKMWRKFLSVPDTGLHFACEVNERIVGLISLRPSRDLDLPGALELVALYFDPAFWGRGFGSQAMRFAVREARKEGFHTLFLWALRENRRAVRFYERCGFRPDGSSRVLDLGAPAVACRFRLPVFSGENNPAG